MFQSDILGTTRKHHCPVFSETDGHDRRWWVRLSIRPSIFAKGVKRSCRSERRARRRAFMWNAGWGDYSVNSRLFEMRRSPLQHRRHAWRVCCGLCCLFFFFFFDLGFEALVFQICFTSCPLWTCYLIGLERSCSGGRCRSAQVCRALKSLDTQLTQHRTWSKKEKAEKQVTLNLNMP